MKLAIAQTGTETFNIGVPQTAEMSLREDDIRKVKKILRDKLYTYKALAPVRELFCNALDIHKQVGSQDRIEIQAPTLETAIFRIRDYGTGLTPEGVKFYCTYLASDKDGDDNQIGGFGLGSKSPFAYTDQCVLKSFVNGQCLIYSLYIDEKDDIAYVLLSVEPTDQPNGLELEIPVEQTDLYTFTQNIRQVVQFTPRNQLKLINVLHPGEPIYDIETDTYGISARNSPTVDFHCSALVGPIRYPVPEEVLTKAGFERYQAKGIILKFNVGEVQLSPTREALSLDPKTESILIERLISIKDEVQARVDEALTKETTEWGRIKRLHKIKSSHPVYVLAKSDLVSSDEMPMEIGDMATRIQYKGDRDGPARFVKQNIKPRKVFYPLRDTIILQDTTHRVLARINNNQYRIGNVVKSRNAQSTDVWLVSQSAIDRLGIEPDFVLSMLAPPTVDRTKRTGRRVYEYTGYSSRRNSNWTAISSDDLPDEYFYVVMNGSQPEIGEAVLYNMKHFVDGGQNLQIYGIPKSNLDLVKDDDDAINLVEYAREKATGIIEALGDMKARGAARKRMREVIDHCDYIEVLKHIDPRLEALFSELSEQRGPLSDLSKAASVNNVFPKSIDLGEDIEIDLEKDPIVRGYKAIMAKNPVLGMMKDANLLRNPTMAKKILSELTASIKLPTAREFKSGIVKSETETQQDAA